MKVTDKKFLNVHQTISPLSVATTVTASSTKGGESSPSSKAEKILVSWTTRKKIPTTGKLSYNKSADTCKYSRWLTLGK